MQHDFLVIIVTIAFMLGLHFILKLTSHNTRIRKLEDKVDALAKEAVSDGMRYMPSPNTISQLIPSSFVSKLEKFLEEVKSHVTDEITSVHEHIDYVEKSVNSLTSNKAASSEPIAGEVITSTVPKSNAVFIDEDEPQK